MTTAESISSYVQLATLLAIAVFTFLNTLRSKKAEKVTEKIHTLVNSNMAVQLRVNMLQAKRIAELTRTKADKELASEAARLYEQHEAKQKEVDATNEPSVK